MFASCNKLRIEHYLVVMPFLLLFDHDADDGNDDYGDDVFCGDDDDDDRIEGKSKQ